MEGRFKASDTPDSLEFVSPQPLPLARRKEFTAPRSSAPMTRYAVGREREVTDVQVLEPPTDKPWGWREMQIRDPDGLRIVIIEVPETHPPRRR